MRVKTIYVVGWVAAFLLVYLIWLDLTEAKEPINPIIVEGPSDIPGNTCSQSGYACSPCDASKQNISEFPSAGLPPKENICCTCRWCVDKNKTIGDDLRAMYCYPCST